LEKLLEEKDNNIKKIVNDNNILNDYIKEFKNIINKKDEKIQELELEQNNINTEKGFNNVVEKTYNAMNTGTN
jgi:arsenate reductase-like glutaredoxin family protein